MRTKVSEGRIFGSILLFLCGLALLLNAKVLVAPIRVSEVGMLTVSAALVLLFFAFRLWKKAFVKV